MNQYDDTNRGGLWKNQDRQSDNHPNARGKVKLSQETLDTLAKNGGVLFLSAWTKRSQAGDPWQSLAVDDYAMNKSLEKSSYGSAPSQSAPQEEDSGIPF